VITLRGDGNIVANNLEKQTCRELGLALKSVDFSATRPPKAEAILQLIEYFRTLPKPLLMHCKSGADRAGLASAIYLMVIENIDVADAKKMFAKKYLHFKSSQTGVLDHILDRFEIRQAEQAITFENWIENQYDPDEIQSSFDASRQR
ncbi:MAG: tyrosine-protein phosphatase, partial [Paracoccaceae bacterium]